MAESQNLVKLVTEKGALGLLGAAIKRVDALVTGVFGTESRELFMIPGRLFQAVRNRSFLNQLAFETQRLIKTGSIPKEYTHSEQCTATLQQLLAALETPPVDQKRFEAIKSVFVGAAVASRSQREDATSLLYMEIVCGLKSGEILLLASVYEVGRHGSGMNESGGVGRTDEWLRKTTEMTGFKSTQLVELYERSLIEKGIILPRITLAQATGQRIVSRHGEHVYTEGRFRLSAMGLELCDLMKSGADAIANLGPNTVGH